jgi:hypothetical protein
MVVARLLVCSLLVGGVAGADQTRPSPSPSRAKPGSAHRSHIKYTPVAGESNIPASAVASAEPAPAAGDQPAAAQPVSLAVVPDPTPKPLPVDRHRGLRIGLGLASGAVLIGGIVALGVVFSSHGDSGSDWGTLVVTRR